MDPEIAAIIAELQSTARSRRKQEALCYEDGGDESDLPLELHVEWRAAIVLQAVFDPENQPSQFGTALTHR